MESRVRVCLDTCVIFHELPSGRGDNFSSPACHNRMRSSAVSHRDTTIVDLPSWTCLSAAYCPGALRAAVPHLPDRKYDITGCCMT